MPPCPGLHGFRNRLPPGLGAVDPALVIDRILVAGVVDAAVAAVLHRGGAVGEAASSVDVPFVHIVAIVIKGIII